LKPSKCKVCGTEYVKSRPLQKVCSTSCAIEHANKLTERKKAKEAAQDRRQTREKLKAMKSKAKLANEAQAVVNKYVRLRDAHLGCISCDKPASWDGQWHASHFRSRGAASGLRFHLWNIHKSCSICNNHKSGNLIEYEPRLREKIGADRVEWLRSQNQVVTFTAEYLNRLKAVFSKKVKRIERGKS
jgi:ribosomal protein L44E